jgi:hypothetical protein
MSEQPQSTDRDAVSPRRRPAMSEALAGQPASFWLASLASLGLIIGGVGPWASAYAFVSLSGTSMHGWREVMVGVVSLAMLGLYHARGARLPLVAAAVAGALGAVQAVATIAQINSNGAVTVLGLEYRYLQPAWGLYIVLGSAIALACSASALVWRASRAAR